MYARIEGTKITQNYEIRKLFFVFCVVFRNFAASNGQKDSKQNDNERIRKTVCANRC